ncbi:hypothetical protein [Pyxidicoccus trucidator]|nr:hypothetical protein [Pyxidicoccus trucidator]
MLQEETSTISIDGQERDLFVSANVSCVTGKSSSRACVSAHG